MSEVDGTIRFVSAHSLLELTLFVSDVDESARFYRQLGLALFENDESSHPRHYDGGVGEVAVQIYPRGDRPGTRVQLGFRVTNIGEIAAGLDELGCDYERPLPRRLRTVDPDGNRVHVSEVSPSRQSS